MEKIHLNQVIPIPLQEILAMRSDQEQVSEVWKKTVTFEQGKHYQVYAPSGKGKSTFIHILYGIRHDFAGEVRLDGQATKQISPRQWANIRQSHFSVVFQDLRLFADLTAWENIQVKLALNAQDRSEQAKEMAEILGIATLLTKKTALLSYGERQRVAIVRALVQDFDFLLLDEPFSHLDEINIAKASKLMQQICQERKAGMIMTSLGYEYGLDFDQRLLL